MTNKIIQFIRDIRKIGKEVFGEWFWFIEWLVGISIITLIFKALGI